MSVCERCGMSGCGSGVGCGVVEWVKRSTLKWFGHIERMGNEEFVKRVHLSSVGGTNRRFSFEFVATRFFVLFGSF